MSNHRAPNLQISLPNLLDSINQDIPRTIFTLTKRLTLETSALTNYHKSQKIATYTLMQSIIKHFSKFPRIFLYDHKMWCRQCWQWRQTDKRTHLMIIRHFPTMACKKMRNVFEIDESRQLVKHATQHPKSFPKKLCN